MNVDIDLSAAEVFLEFLEGETNLTNVWGHPAYDLTRTHASILGRTLTEETLESALAGEENAFSHGTNLENLPENRQRIEELLKHVRTNEERWSSTIERELNRIASPSWDENIVVHFAIGYDTGIGLSEGAFVNVNDPLAITDTRQLLYMAIHEAAHVLYDREHGFSDILDIELLSNREGQVTFFETVLHTEAFATYLPLRLRRAEGALGDSLEHPICSDYRVIQDKSSLADHVERYDFIQTQLAEESLPPEELSTHIWGQWRLPYRVGCAMVSSIASENGSEELVDALTVSPGEFTSTYDQTLDRYRGVK